MKQSTTFERPVAKHTFCTILHENDLKGYLYVCVTIC